MNRNENILPDIVEKYLHYSGGESHKAIREVKLKQKGRLRLKENGQWKRFKASQVFHSFSPGFVWNANVFPMRVKDTFLDGQASMYVRILGVIPFMKITKRDELSQSALIRLLSEMVWMPTFFKDERIEWEGLDSSMAKAVLRVGDFTAKGIFTFNEEGQIVEFQTNRYREIEGRYLLERWTVKYGNYQEKSGFRIPIHGEVTWNLDSGDFSWFVLEDIPFYKVNY